MAQIIDKEKARFRIVIREIATGKSKTLSLKDGKAKLSDIEKRIKEAFR